MGCKLNKSVTVNITSRGVLDTYDNLGNNYFGCYEIVCKECQMVTKFVFIGLEKEVIPCYGENGAQPMRESCGSINYKGFDKQSSDSEEFCKNYLNVIS